MSLPLNTQGIDSILRLANLKNVDGRRRVKNGAPLLPEVENEEIDVSNTAMPPMLPKNLPEADLGGELTSQSYDVRANEVIDPNQAPIQEEMPEEEKGFFRKLGGSLRNIFSQNPYREDELLNREDQAMPKSIQEPSVEPIQQVYSKLNQYLGSPPIEQQSAIPQASPIPSEEEWKSNLDRYGQGYIPEESTPYSTPEKYPLEGKVLRKDVNPEFFLAPSTAPAIKPQPLPDKSSELNAQIDEAQKNPQRQAVYGSTDQFARSPELVNDFREYTGMDFNEETAEITKKFEKVLSDLEGNLNETNAGYDEQESRIKERILNNQATDADKFYIGLALLIPTLVGGVFGKEAGLASLGGSFKGLSSVFGDRQKNILSDEELLSQIKKDRSEIDLKKSELELERAKLPAEIKKMLPEDEYADLKGMNIYQFKTPEGEVIAEGPEVLPGIYADLKYYNTPEKRKVMGEKAQDLAKERAALETADDSIYKLIEVAQQLKDPTAFGKTLSYLLAKSDSEPLKLFITKNSPDVYVDGRKQNAAIYMNSLIEQVKDGYRRNEQMRAITQTVADHISKMVENPIYGGYKPNDFIDQLLLLRNKANNFYLNRAKDQGFLPQPIESDFGKKNRKLYEEMNKKEERKGVSALKQEALRHNANL